MARRDDTWQFFLASPEWEKIVERLQAERADALSELVQMDLDTPDFAGMAVAKVQGAVRVIDLMLGLPEELKQKEQEGEDENG